MEKGTTVRFNPTGREFTLTNVTDKRVVWCIAPEKSSWGKNTLKKASISRKKFNDGIKNGTYTIL